MAVKVKGISNLEDKQGIPILKTPDSAVPSTLPRISR